MNQTKDGQSSSGAHEKQTHLCYIQQTDEDYVQNPHGNKIKHDKVIYAASLRKNMHLP